MISSVLLLATESKDVFGITSVVYDVIWNLILSVKSEYKVDLLRFKLQPESKSVYCYFKYKDEQRMLQICFAFDNECSDYYNEVFEGSKVSLSFTQWGEADMYLKLLRNKFVELGYVTYFCSYGSDVPSDWERK